MTDQLVSRVNHVANLDEHVLERAVNKQDVIFFFQKRIVCYDLNSFAFLYTLNSISYQYAQSASPDGYATFRKKKDRAYFQPSAYLEWELGDLFRLHNFSNHDY